MGGRARDPAVGVVGLAAACGNFRHDLDRDLARIATITGHARDAGARLLALPLGALGGAPSPPDDDGSHARRPEPLPLGHPLLRRVAELAGDLVVCLGFTERTGDAVHATAVCLHGDGVLGLQRQVHVPADGPLRPGDGHAAFDTPVGRIGLLVDRDKEFPETARALALDGATTVVAVAAWRASTTHRSTALVHDRRARLFDLYDQVRAAENQVVLVSANQSGGDGRHRFVGSAKVVGPGGEVLAGTGPAGGLAVTAVDVAYEVGRARAADPHLPLVAHPARS